ncbi:MAG: hypothetical protein B7Z75_04610 [Acidocella sp. 20-57-95]|nr:MAG: hypothetical protein B7Z75_04610 [Acidocella sp. 20-57-95]OYV57160.1 MAG: hypothetical protein B7Z71_12400 [Acidocella sp. 21-58-7]HQT64292.1 hypothetical protein [Acidocella sp.]
MSLLNDETYWSIEQALCWLAFGDPSQTIVPPPPDGSKLQQTTAWLDNRLAREALVGRWKNELTRALNNRQFGAMGRPLPHGTGVFGAAPGPMQDIPDWAHGDVCTIDLTHHAGGGGLLLGFSKPGQDAGDFIGLYVYVLIRRTDIQSLRDAVIPPEPKMRGRPSDKLEIMAEHERRKIAGLSLSKATSEARHLCKWYAQKFPGRSYEEKTIMAWLKAQQSK